MDLHLLIIAPDSYPPTTGESIVTMKFLAGLAKKGCAFTVIHKKCVTTLYPPAEIPSLESILPHLVDPIKTSSAGKGRVRARFELAGWLRGTIAAGSRVIKKEKTCLLVSRSMPVFGHLPALILSRRYGIPWVANWSDPAPLSISPPPFGTGKKLIDPSGILCRQVAQRAGLHTFPNRYLADYMTRYYPPMQGKTAVIPHIAHSGLCSDKVQANAIFTVCHIGSLWQRNPLPFFNGLRLFLEKYGKDKIRVSFVGLKEEGMEEQITRLGLGEEVTFLPPVSYNESLEHISRCDVALVIEADTTEGIFLPSKVLDIIQLGKPILSVSPLTGVMADLLGTERGGITVDRNDSASIFYGLDKLYQAHLTGTLQDLFGSRELRSSFSEERVVNKFISAIGSAFPELQQGIS